MLQPSSSSMQSLSLSEIFAHTTEREYLSRTLEGEGEWGVFLVKVLVLLVGLSTLSFSLDSVEELHGKYQALFLGIDVLCLIFFTFEYILRIGVARNKLKYAVQLMSIIDLLSILPSWLNILYHSFVPRLQFFRILRLFKFLISTRKGHESAIAFQSSWQENSSLMLASTYLFVCSWTLLSCLQHFAEYDNEEMLHCVPPSSHRHHFADARDGEVSTGCVCDDQSCVGQDCICEARYGSLVSSMFFTLIEFSGTYQLAAYHTTLGRFASVATVVTTVGVFAIPTSLFAAALNQAANVIHSEYDSEGHDDARDNGQSSSLNVDAPPPEQDINSIEAIAQHVSSGRLVYITNAVPAYTESSRYIMLSKVLVSLSSMCAILATSSHQLSLLTACFIIVDVICIITFGTEHVCRVAAEGPQNYIDQLFTSVLPLADLASWIPSLVIYLGNGMFPPPYISLSVALFRILKMERVSNGFWILRRVFNNSWSLLSVGGMATFCSLMFTSTLLFYTERDNPDPNVRQYYTSVPMSLWTTMVNISGMVKVDYSYPGRMIASFLCLQTIAVFAVPIGAIGGGFRDVMQVLSKHKSGAEDDKNLHDVLKDRKSNGEGSPLNSRLCRDESYGSTKNFRCDNADDAEQITEGDIRVQAFSWIDFKKRVKLQVNSNWFMTSSISATLFSVVVEIVSTCSFAQKNPSWNKWEGTVEMIVIFWFTVEYICRTFAFGSTYVTSKLGILDFLATLPWYIAHGFVGSTRLAALMIRYQGPLRFLRLMRLVRLDAYAPSLSLIDNAIADCWDGLKLALYSFIVLWFLFNEWLYLSEHGNGDNESVHFKTALSSLQYSGMLLTGGYGEMDDLSLSGQVCCCLAVLVAVGISAVPASVLANSFVNVLQEEAEKERIIKLNVAVKTQRLFRRRRSMDEFVGVVRNVMSVDATDDSSLRLHRHLVGLDKESWYPFINISLTSANVFAVLLESVSAAYEIFPETLWVSFEAICSIFITLDYFCILLTIQHNFDHKCSRMNYVGSVRGLCALCSLVPFWIKTAALVYYGQTGTFSSPQVIVGFRVLRVFRIIGLDRYIKCFYYLSAVLSKVSSVLTAAGIVAFVIWVGGATLFYYAELDADGDSGVAVFQSIPDSMYYCALFLAKDWELQDFTPMGSVLCVFLSLFGVAIFALPVGVLFEGFQNVIKEQNSNLAKMS